MLESRLRFIGLATRPLAGKKQAAETLAQGELMDRLAHAAPAAGDETLESATARLEQVAPAAAWKLAVASIVAVILLSAVAAALVVSAYGELGRFGGFFGAGGRGSDTWEKRLTRSMSPAQKQFFLRNSNGIEDEETIQWFRDAAADPPDAPADIEEFLAGARIHGQDLPDPPGDLGRKIDPGNGLWALLDMQSPAWNYPGRYRSSGTAPSSMAYASSPGYKRALALWEEYTRAPRKETYIPSRTAERLKMLPPARGLADVADSSAFAFSQNRSFTNTGTVDGIITARADELAFNGDTEGLRTWIRQWDRLTLDSLDPEQGGKFEALPIYYIERSARMLGNSAAKLHLAEEERRMRKWHTEFSALSRPSSAGPTIGVEYHAPACAGIRYYYFSSFLARGDLVSREELTPGLLAEHAAADRFSAVAGALLFALLSLLALIESWRRARHVRGLAGGLMPLLRTPDYLWLAGLGVLLPLAWHVVWMRLTSLGCRDFTILLGDMIPAFARTGCSLIFAMTMLLQTARWRLARRAGFIAMRPAALWPGWIIALMPALLLPATGLVRLQPKLDEEYLACACAAMGIPLLWLLWRGAAIGFGPKHSALGGVMLCRILLPLLLLAGALLAGLTPLLKMEECKWMARYTLCGPDPEGSGKFILQARAEKEFRARLLKAME